MRLKSSSIHLPSTAPTFLSSPQGIQGCTMAAAAPGLTLTQKCFGWSAPARSVLTSAEPEQKNLLRLCLSRDEADTSDSFWHISAHTEATGV